MATLCEAIDGCHRDPFHCGENDRGKTYHALSLIMRDGDHVAKFIEVPVHQSVMSEKERRGQRAGENFLERIRAEHGIEPESDGEKP